MLHERCSLRSLLPKGHALLEITLVVRQGHRKAKQIQFSVAFSAHFFEDRLLAIDFGFDGSLPHFRGSGVPKFQQATKAARDRAPMLAVMATDAANGADRNAVFGPAARGQGKA